MKKHSRCRGRTATAALVVTTAFGPLYHGITMSLHPPTIFPSYITIAECHLPAQRMVMVRHTPHGSSDVGKFVIQGQALWLYTL